MLRGSSPSRKPSVHHTVAQQSTDIVFFLRKKTIKGRFAILHGQGTLELVEGETGCVGPVEEVRLLG